MFILYSPLETEYITTVDNKSQYPARFLECRCCYMLKTKNQITNIQY